MKKLYYAHRKISFVADYFGEIGPKVRISWLRYLLMKLTGYRVSVEIEE